MSLNLGDLVARIVVNAGEAESSLTGFERRAGASAKRAGAAMGSEMSAGAKKAAASVKAAEAEISKAQKMSADTAGRLRVAELRLQEIRDKEGASASSIAAAEERVAAAERNSQLAAERSATASAQLRNAQIKAAGTTDVAAASSGRFASGLGVVTTKMGGLGGKVGEFAKSMAPMAGLFAGFEAAKMGSEAVKSAMDFQKGSQVLVTAAGESMSNLKSIRSGLMNISSQTGTSLDQMTEGMYTVEKAGVRGGKGLDIMRAAAKGAKDEGADLQTVTDALTTIMTTSNGKITNSSKAMNALMVAAGHSKTSLQEFSGSLGSVLPTASKVGITFDQVSGAISAMTSQGMSAQRSSQNLNRFISSLISPTMKMSQEMDAFGISGAHVSDMLGKKGLQATIDYLSNSITKQLGAGAQKAMEAVQKLPKPARDLFNELKNGTVTVGTFGTKIAGLKGVTDAQKNVLGDSIPAAQSYTRALAAMTGGSTNLRTALMLTGKGTDTFKKSTEDVGKAMNSTSDFNKKWNITSKTTANELSIAKQSISNVGVSLATSLLPFIGKAANGFANFLMVAKSFASANKTWLVPMVKTVGLAVAGFTAFSAISSITSKAMSAYGTVSKTVTALMGRTVVATAAQTAATEAQTAATGTAEVAQRGLNLAMRANVIGLIITALAALVVGVIYAYKHFAVFRDTVNAVGDALKTAFLASVNWISGSFIPFFTKTLPKAFTSTKNWITNTWGTVSSAVISPFQSAWDWLSGPFVRFFTKSLPSDLTGVGRAIAAPFVSAWHGIETAASAVWTGIEAAFKVGAKVVETYLRIQWKITDVLIVTPLRAALRLVQDAWAALKGPFTAAAKWVGGVFLNLWHREVAGIHREVALVAGPVKAAWNAIEGPFSAAAKWVAGFAKGVWQRDVAFVASVVRAVVGPVKAAWTDIRNVFLAAWDWVKGTFDAAWSKVSGIIHSAVSAGASGVGSAWTTTRGHFTDAKNWVTGSWSKGWSAIKGRMTGPISAARGAIGILLGKGKSGLQSVFSDAVAGIGKIWNGLESVVKAPIRFIVDTVLNNGLIAAFNKVAQFAWGTAKHNIGKINLPQGFAVGTENTGGRPGEPRGVVHGQEAVIPHLARERAERERPGGLGYLIKTGKWPVGPAAETFGVNQNAPRGNSAPITDLSAVPGNIRQLISKGPGPNDTGIGALMSAGGGGTGSGVNPIAYADSQVGDYGWYNRCLAFVNAAWDYTVGRFKTATARESANAGPRTKGGTAPAGAAGYWDTGPAGHVALSAGDGTYFSNDVIKPGMISRVAKSMIDRWGPFMGWWNPAGNKGIWGRITAGISGAAGAVGNFLDPTHLFTDAIKKAMTGFKAFASSPFGQTLEQLPTKLAGQALNWAKGELANIGGAITGSGTGRWKNTVIQALRLNNLPTTAPYVNAWLKQIQTESGGDQTIIQGIADINSAMGNRAEGLVQVTPTTFAQYHLPGLNSILVGLDNLAAGMNYAKHRYPNMLSVIGHGHGYLNGGMALSDQIAAFSEDGRPELVVGPQYRHVKAGTQTFNADQTAAIMTGQGGGTVNHFTILALDPIATGREIEKVILKTDRAVGGINLSRQPTGVSLR